MPTDASRARASTGNPIAGTAAPRTEHKFAEHAEADILSTVYADFLSENVDQLPLCSQGGKLGVIVQDGTACVGHNPSRLKETPVPLRVHRSERGQKSLSQEAEKAPLHVAVANLIYISLPELGFGSYGCVLFRSEVAEEGSLRDVHAIDQFIESRRSKAILGKKLKSSVGERTPGAKFLSFPKWQPTVV
ncbi:MAG: hypothetical protein P8011_17330 [Acidihalobacter sp.]|uniref:hypothetical protein n=1 Tax=Acidihalobacter sp. TaxID=1872108 RepID=UPI00307F1E09